MTAINIFLKPDAAYMLTDTARYDEKGVVREIASKVARSELLRLAVAYAGCATTHAVIERMRHAESQREAIEQLPEIARLIRAANPDGPDGELMLATIAWSTDRAQAEAWVVSTARAWLGDDYEPGTLVAIEGMTMPFVDIGDLAKFDPTRDGLAVIEAQRLMPYAPGDPTCYIGGAAELTRIDAKGVTRRFLRTWPDRVGERIAA